jgi:flagellar hook assembly protein FlgD
MSSNCDYILRNFLNEPYDPAAAGVIAESGDRVSMAQNAPNPFMGTTRISFSLPAEQEVRIRVYDVMGREVATLMDSKADAGKHSVTWNGRGSSGHRAAPGVYWYSLRAGEEVLTRRMVLLD